MRIYVASSWRNHMQTAVVHALKSVGHEVYDFKNPEPNTGFHWSEVGMESYNRETNSDVPVSEYFEGIDHPRAVEGFGSDMAAMEWADTCLLVLPCGRSAHLELGWFVGQGKQTVILLGDEMVTPELMYRMVDVMLPTFNDMLGWAGVQPDLDWEAWLRD